MVIGIDARIYKTGIGRYVQNLIKELEVIDQTNDYVVFLRRSDWDLYQPKNPRFSKVIADYPPYSFVEQLLLPVALFKARVNLTHFTNFNLPVLWWGRYVVTIHDLIHQQHSTFGSTTRNKFYYLFKKLVYFLAIRWVALRAIKIIVPSEDARHDVVRYLRANENKVVVTYEGYDAGMTTKDVVADSYSNLSRILEKYGIQKPFLLYVATMYPHKNHIKLIEAFEEIVKEDSKEDGGSLKVDDGGSKMEGSNKGGRWMMGGGIEGGRSKAEDGNEDKGLRVDKKGIDELNINFQSSSRLSTFDLRPSSGSSQLSTFKHQPSPNTSQSSSLQLVLVGKVDYFSQKLKKLVDEKGLADRIIFPNFLTTNGYLPDKDLAEFYRQAFVYVFPSLKEGFGIPILEAWNFGVPVIASNVSSLPEIGGDAVLYFDPYSKDDIKARIKQVLTDNNLRADLVAKGSERLKLFSWGKMAAQTLSMYHDLSA